MTAPKPASTATNRVLITSIDATTTVTVPKEKVDDTTETNEVDEAAATTTIIGEEDETQEQREQRIRLTHELLARQLEYYFSEANLSRDTYLSTLGDLNDGYVPLSIIANFAKVQALAPFESALDAVCSAATDYSELLEMVELNEQSRKVAVVTNESTDNSDTIWAVGTISGKAIPTSQIQSQIQRRSSNDVTAAGAFHLRTRMQLLMLMLQVVVVVVFPILPVLFLPFRCKPSRLSTATPSSNSSNNNVQNTIILREVSEDVEETVVRSLFDFDGCPLIQTAYLDLHNCWFVTLDTSSKDEMVNVMMKLRSKKFPSGDPVMARLKSLASASPLSANAAIYNPTVSTLYAPQFFNNDGATNGNRNGRKKRSSNNRKRNSNRGNNHNNSCVNNCNSNNNIVNNQYGAVNGGYQNGHTIRMNRLNRHNHLRHILTTITIRIIVTVAAAGTKITLMVLRKRYSHHHRWERIISLLFPLQPMVIPNHSR